MGTGLKAQSKPVCGISLSDRVARGKVVGNLDVVALSIQVEALRVLEPVEGAISGNDVIGFARRRTGGDVVEIERVPELLRLDVVAAGSCGRSAREAGA